MEISIPIMQDEGDAIIKAVLKKIPCEDEACFFFDPTMT